MTAQQFIWWLTGNMECAEQTGAIDKHNPVWKNIRHVLEAVTCWEIEQGVELK